MDKLRRLVYSIVLILIITAFFSPAKRIHAQDQNLTVDNNRHSADSTGLIIPSDDGPYVLLQSDTSAMVIDMCNGALERRIFYDKDTIYFRGFCADSGIEYMIPLMQPAVDQQVFDSVSRIFAVSDIHGDLTSLIAILRNSGVLDKNTHWSWGTGHLVIVGDIFDRGDKVTDCLWLIYRLAQEAQRAGGRVHYILGNHEPRILGGDYRDVNEKYLSGTVPATGLEYKELYGPKTALGQWLRTRHAAMKINGMLFVHGGIGPRVIEQGISLAQINEEIRAGIDGGQVSPAVDSLRQFLLGKHGPLWYRGYIEAREGSYSRASAADIDRVLQFYDATAIVVGHTEVPQISGLYEDRVITIDVPVEELGGLQALLWDNGVFYRVIADGDAEPIE